MTFILANWYFQCKIHSVYSTQGYAFINRKMQRDEPKPIISNTPSHPGTYNLYVPTWSIHI